MFALTMINARAEDTSRHGQGELSSTGSHILLKAATRLDRHRHEPTLDRHTPAARPERLFAAAPSLGDQILTLANGKTQQEIAAACDGVRANHVGIAIARHKRAGRIEERDGKLYATQSTQQPQPSAA